MTDHDRRAVFGMDPALGELVALAIRVFDASFNRVDVTRAL